MSQNTISRTLYRIRAPHRTYENHHPQQQLFVKVRNLLKTAQAIQASQLFINHLDSHLPSQTKAGIRREQQDEWLWKAAVLFRSYNHPELALQALNHLSTHLPVPIKAAVSAVQACSDLVWNYPTHHHEQQKAFDPQSGCDGHHTQLVHALLLLTNRHANHRLHMAENTTQEALGQPLKKEKMTLTTVQDTDDNTRVLEVIIANILKLGDMDWIVSIFRDFYPRYTHQLGAYLYPDSSPSSCSEPPDQKPLDAGEVPSGRLVKFLVTGYTVCKDLRRAFGVIKFHWTLLDSLASAARSADTVRDLTPEVTFLRGISKTTMGSMEMRMGMVTQVLGYLGKHSTQLDTYALDGLLEMRYRLRMGWAFRRRQLSTLEVISAAVNCQLTLFLLHRARPSTFSRQSCTALVRGPVQGQHTLASWKYRPSAATFTILLLALRSHLRYQTRPIARPLPAALNDHSYGYYRHSLDGEKRPKKRRPSPGAHRAILAQILAFEDLNRLACRPGASANHMDDGGAASRWEHVGCLPARMELLTAKNVRLLVECLLLARDYVSVWVLVSRPTMTDTALHEAVEQVQAVRGRLARHWTDLAAPSVMNMNDDDDDEGAKTLPRKLEMQLRQCFALDMPSAHQIWEEEERLVRHRLTSETAKLSANFLHHSAFSETTLDFLRIQVGKEQLDILSYGITRGNA